MESYKERYERYRKRAEAELQAQCAHWDREPKILFDSMRYALLGGGKRLRPVLFLSVLDRIGGHSEEEGALAAAIEMIHTYSLVHDDLPAMDNDDFRRGKPSVHKQFGEANAILCGDALLNEAAILAVEAAARSEGHAAAARELLVAAGATGMIAGQTYDLYYEKSEAAGEAELNKIYEGKTGKLITAPLVMAACIAGKRKTELKAFGRELGLLFQLTDDILDVVGDEKSLGKSVGKDEEEGKLTAVKVYGLQGAKERANAVAARCLSLLRAVPEEDGFLTGLVQNVLSRTN